MALSLTLLSSNIKLPVIKIGMHSVERNPGYILFCSVDVPYEITVYTGDIKSAGTDSSITMTMFGTDGTTPEFVLDKDESRFERACVDLIRMDLDDVGKLLKVRIAVDGKGTRPDWFLEKVLQLS